jgi:hypothetical protein
MKVSSKKMSHIGTFDKFGNGKSLRPGQTTQDGNYTVQLTQGNTQSVWTPNGSSAPYISPNYKGTNPNGSGWKGK